MNAKTRRNDWQISGLIDDAQSYSNPTDTLPQPPPSRSDPEPERHHERLPPPDWFEPIPHPDDREQPQDGDVGEVPLLDGDEAVVPDPTPSELAAINSLGADALAYYAPFHFYNRTTWGIYIRDYGIAYLASKFLGRNKLTPSDNWILRCAYWLLLEHEYFHFQTELAATRYEALTRPPTLDSYKRLFFDGQASWLEEAIANACAYRRLEGHEDGLLTFPRIQGLRGFAANWMKTQGPGYRDFDDWCRSSKSLRRGEGAMIARLHEISGNHSRNTVPADNLQLYRAAQYSKVPIVRVRDSRVSWLSAGRLFPKAHGLQVSVHTREHPPAHIHVEFPQSGDVVRLVWDSLEPLPGEPTLSRRSKKNLDAYLGKYRKRINEKVLKAFQDIT